MKPSRLWPLALALLLAVPLTGTGAEGTRTLEGEYRSGDGDGPVRATFVPVGSGLWNVVFDFTFNGRRHTYRGAAEGSFGGGKLGGKVENEYGRRTFSFRGEYADGVFRGRHYEIERGREVPTGTLYLQE